MFHAGRSGSTVLADLLGQHPKVFWDGEVYTHHVMKWGVSRRDRSDEATRLIRRRMNCSPRPLYGFEVKYFHVKCSGVPFGKYVEQLRRLGLEHFIVLDRRNHLRQLVSSLIGEKSSRYHQRSGERAVLTRIVLDVNEIKLEPHTKAMPLIEHLKGYEEDVCMLEDLLHQHNVLRLTYETDVLKDPLVGYRRICNFVNIDCIEYPIRYGKTNPFYLEDIILNYEEVKNTLGGSPFEWMLDD